jgi:hypothetical protein
MKFIYKAILLVFIAFQTPAFGAVLFFEKYDWDFNPKFEKVSSEGQSAIILKDLKAVEYFYDEDYNTLLQLYTVHNKIQVNTHEAVELYNKHYMPMNRVLGIEDLRVRVLTNDSVREIDEIDLKDYQGEDSYSSYKYFAIEGVEVGSQIEYIYTFKMLPQLEGSREFFQSDELKLNTEFHIFCENKMFFNTKSYNGFDEMALDTTIAGKNHYFANIPQIEPLKPELYAPYRNSLMRVEYKLDYIQPADEVKLFTYEQLSNELNSYLRADISKKEIKALKSVSKDLKLDGMSESGKIRAIENYIKRNITISDTGGDELTSIESILEKLVASQRGVIKLFVSLFDINDVNYRYGLTSDRSRVTMDPDFESYSFLENYVFYFPGVDKYMAPTETLYRLGFIPFNWSNNYGLLIKNVKLGETTAGIGDVQFIEPLAYDVNEDILYVNVDFGTEFDNLNLDIERTLTGYNATFIQPIFELIPESETKIVVTELLNLSGKDVDLYEFNLKNASLDSFYLKPFIIQGMANTNSSFYDKAGDRYLFKIGEIIGEQVEMYQEEERKLPVENEFNRNYLRQISFDIPDGYNIRNLDDLNINLSFKDQNGQEAMGFQSGYEVNGNTVTVKIHEFYKKLVLPIDQFGAFREIINAAADFNKKVLVFEKG